MALNRADVFEDDKGNPVIFFFRPCAARSKVQPIIEEHGGRVTARMALNAIKLANDDDYLVSDDYYSVRYIEDCVKANKMLDKEKYRLQPRKMVIRDASEDQVSDISFDEDEPQRIRASMKYFQGRKMYTYADDMAILNYIISNDYHEKVAGNTIWKEMEDLQITKHSASSMNTRYRKTIKYNLNLYTIPVTHKKKLNLDYMVTSDDTDSSTERRRPNLINSKKDEISLKSPSKASSPKDTKAAKQADGDNQNKKGSVGSSKSASNSKSPKKTTRSQKSKYFSDCSDDLSDVSDSIPVNNDRKKRKLDFVTSNQASKNDKQKSSNISTPQKSKTVKTAENEESEIDKQCSEPAKRQESLPSKKSLDENYESPDNRITRGKGRLSKTKPPVGTPSKSPTKSNEPKKSLETNGNTTTDSAANANSKQKRTTSHKLQSNPPDQQSNAPTTNKISQRTLYNTEGVTLTPGQMMDKLNSSQREEHNTSVSSVFKPSYGDSTKYKRGSRKKASKTQSPYSKDVHRLDDSVDDDELEDDFDKELMKRVAKTSTQASDDEVPTPSKMRKSKLSTEKHVSNDPLQISTSTKKLKSSEETPEKKSKKTKKRSCRTAYVTVFTDDEEEIDKEVALEKSVTDNSLDEAEIKEFILFLCEEYRLTVAQVQYIIYINNGDVNDTLEWLRTSGECNGKLTWDVQDDEKLDGHLDELFRKYGETTVRNRIAFLEGT
ncbi:nucleolar and coiled-body phosphoprotein 1-like [Saccostrea echinata]|uniref:nucleolar and coiled-body phosphoprotein 1-like n=1 Tax=Saccostrea echinata TaxID=191078 RepID=UPI002A8167A0|nr:nucleolar and coiled-body phosphoprotein 1-like [Saccostrea echinata]